MTLKRFFEQNFQNSDKMDTECFHLSVPNQFSAKEILGGLIGQIVK